MASQKNLQELFHDTLKDIYFAEKKILSALPKMAKAAQSQDLKAAFEKHETETEEHVARLEKVFGEIDEAPRGKTCDAIMGIIEEGQEIMKEFKGAPRAGCRPSCGGAGGRALRARYGTLRTWAAELGLNQVAIERSGLGGSRDAAYPEWNKRRLIKAECHRRSLLGSGKFAGRHFRRGSRQCESS
jgi:ferritin-like metal-binding protein YciE